jgi:hypothetical protein
MPPLLRALIFIDLVVGGALVLAWQLSPVSWQVPAARVADADSLRAVRIARVAPQSDASPAMFERPLFDPDRRRETLVALDSAPSSADAFSALTLLGLVQAEHGDSAIVQTDGAVRRLRPGERIGPWTLVDVSEQNARFIGNGGQTREIALQRAPQSRRSTPPAATGPAPQGSAAVPVREAEPAAVDRDEALASDDPIIGKTFEERVAERRARREGMQQRLDR